MTSTHSLRRLASSVALMAVCGVFAEGNATGDIVVASGPGSIDPGPSELRGAVAAAALTTFGLDDVVADRSGTEPETLLAQLRSDPLLFVTLDGMVGVTEPAMPHTDMPAQPAPSAPSTPTAGARSVPVDPLALHSRPSSSRVVYLDVDGHVTEDRHWNRAYDLPTITAAPFDTDGYPGSLSNDEGERIEEIWERVAEDFAPFDVDVTTADPGLDGLRRTSGADTAFGVRVVITSSDWYGEHTGRPLGGLALVNVFGASPDQAAFVFAGNLGGSPRLVGEAASHEAGHTFGLFHDGSSSSAYYTGHGDWAPIMGVGYDKAITQWSRGEYPAANNSQDDVAVLAGLANVAPDDHPDVAPAEPVSSTARIDGLLAVGDRDVFVVDVGAGPLSVTLRPGSPYTDLHASVTVRSGDTVVAQASPATATGWSAAVSPVVPAGAYVIEVTPVGWSTAQEGFTAYASAGAYRLDIAGVARAGEPPPNVDPTGSGPTARFEPVPPTRLVDTRTGLGGSTRLAAGQSIEVQIAGRDGIPASASAAVITVTVVSPTAPGFLTASPCTAGPARTSTVNYAAGQVVANTTIATLDARGGFCVFSSSEADVLIDVTGWLGPTGEARFRPAGPIRIADTRVGLAGARLEAGGTLSIDVGALVPPGTTAIAANVTAVGASADGYLTAYPCAATLPATSTVNHVAGEARANNTIVGISGSRLCIYSHAAADVVVDLVGAFGVNGLSYRPADPTRVVDTRTSDLVPGGTSLAYRVGTPGSGVGAPVAASVNVTAVDNTGPGYVTTYDCSALPVASTLNQRPGAVDANGAIVPIGAGTETCAWALTSGNLVIDVIGWWVP